MKKKFVIIIFLMCTLMTNAQKMNVKFGKIDKSDLEMKIYDKDTSASAVVLFDKGEFSERTFIFTRFTRIKILKKAGYEYANQVFYNIPKANISGYTYNLENDEIKKYKLKSESIFTENIYQKSFNTRIAMPNVKEGSVIDIEISYQGFPNEWLFQNEIPVKWSELYLERSNNVNFNKNAFGFFPITVVDDNHWIAKDVPAIKKESYINSIYNYITKFEFCVESISFPGYYKSFATNWSSIAKNLYENDYFGLALSTPSDLKKIGKAILNSTKTTEEKLKSAVEAVKVVKWNQNKSLFTTKNSVSYVYKEKIGNSADINLILLSLLQYMDFKAFPLVLSTRDNGIISQTSPNYNKLNYVIVCVKSNDKTYYLDATEKYLPYNLLPERCLNWTGIILYNSEKTAIVNLETQIKSKTTTLCNLSISNDLTISGKTINNYTDYAAFNFRKKFEKYTSDNEYVDEWQKENSGILLKNLKIDNLDSIYKSVSISFEIKAKNHIIVSDSDIYIKPFLFEEMKENPFKLESRNYPIDFAYGMEKNLVFIYNIPKEFVIKNLPKSISFSTPDKSANFIYNISNFNNTITINCKFNINKPLFTENEYGILKEFFAQVIKKNSETIVLRQK